MVLVCLQCGRYPGVRPISILWYYVGLQIRDLSTGPRVLRLCYIDPRTPCSHLIFSLMGPLHREPTEIGFDVRCSMSGRILEMASTKPLIRWRRLVATPMSCGDKIASLLKFAVDPPFLSPLDDALPGPLAQPGQIDVRLIHLTFHPRASSSCLTTHT